jgi:hypothetical protein
MSSGPPDFLTVGHRMRIALPSRCLWHEAGNTRASCAVHRMAVVRWPSFVFPFCKALFSAAYGIAGTALKIPFKHRRNRQSIFFNFRKNIPLQLFSW